MYFLYNIDWLLEEFVSCNCVYNINDCLTKKMNMSTTLLDHLYSSYRFFSLNTVVSRNASTVLSEESMHILCVCLCKDIQVTGYF